ncbi:hypothetical protein [Paenibacillus glacialis]|uniref:hypothetical protein n=1 Tax=Paenibacillus glacialis TaxID=494026 RepID=UPI000A90641B|nr:hypothetical protein [Paenibacillus glacialis]
MSNVMIDANLFSLNNLHCKSIPLTLLLFIVYITSVLQCKKAIKLKREEACYEIEK